MGKKDAISGSYLSHPERFAQIYNVAVFGGKTMIQPEKLRPLDSSETDRLIPVITLCVYWGSEPWTGPRNLHEMLDIPAGLEQYKPVFDSCEETKRQNP